MLTITQPQLVLIVVAARERELEARADNAAARSVAPARDRLRRLIARLEPEELIELVALAWIGRGDFDAAALPAALHQAQRLMGTYPVEYLATMSELAGYLERALTALGYRAEECQMLPA